MQYLVESPVFESIEPAIEMKVKKTSGLPKYFDRLYKAAQA
jgi:hypothetical protein